MVPKHRGARRVGGAAKATATTLKHPFPSRPRRAVPKRVLVLGSSALVVLLGTALAVSRVIRVPHPAHPAHPARRQLPTLGDVPPFAFADTEGRMIGESALRGHVWIADFIYTRCTTMCPIITAKMSLLRRAIPSADLRFVSFSIDPDHDTPEVLKAYAATWNNDPRWLLLSPPAAQIAEFAKAMKVPFEHTAIPREPILHTSLFFLVDGRGQVRGAYGSLDDKAVLRLVADATMLDAGAAGMGKGDTKSKEKKPETSAASRGLGLFQTLGCHGCHADLRTGPLLGGLAGRTVRLAGGATVAADDAYLRQSILDPGDKVVSGYDPLMPSYRDYLTATEVDDLVAYLHSLVATEGAAQAPPTREGDDIDVQDPVCRMKIKRDHAAARSEYKGKTYYFCSDLCRDRFAQDPARYANATGPALH
jgi:protein SCO1/2